MKPIIISIVLFFYYLPGFSQPYQTVDSASMSCIYLYEFQEDSTTNYSKKNQEMTLQVGARKSKFVSTNEIFSDSVLMAHADEEPTAEGFQKIYQLTSGSLTHSFCRNYVFKNYPTDGYYTQTTYINGKYFMVKEPCKLNWVLKDGEALSILGLTCQKAETHFAGRDYEAWFTTEIPISEGPYKFCGLPGLIVKVQDKKNQHSYTLTNIKKHIRPIPIVYKNMKYTEISSKDYVKALSALNATLYNKFSSGENIKLNDETKARALNNLKSRNNFIEKY